MFQARKILCLDWDKHSLRLVVARIVRGRMQLEDAHAHRIPADVSADDPERMGRFLAQMLEVHQIRQRHAILDIPRDRAVITRLRLPPTPAGEVAAAARFQAQRELPFPMDEAELDFVITRRNEAGLTVEVLLAAVRRETLHSYVSTVKAAGLTPTRIGLRPYANLVSVGQLPAMLDQRALFIDVGPAVTEIDVIRGRTLEFSRSASVGVPFYAGELVTDDSRVSSKAELSQMQLVDTAHNEVLDELMLEVTRTLQAFRATEDNAVVDQIVVAGGTGIEPALVDALDDRLGLPVTLFDPTPTLGVAEYEATKLRAFSSALGLAWGLSRGGLLELDFLNPKRPVERHAHLRRRLRIGGLAAALLVVAVGGWTVSDRMALRGELEALRQVNGSYRRELADFYEIDNRVLSARDWETESRLGVVLEHLLNLCGQLTSPGKDMLLTNFNFRPQSGEMTVRLYAKDQQTAEAFTRKLNGFERDGQRPYVAKLGPWLQVKTIDPRFAGKSDVRIQIVELADHLAEAKARDKARERRVKDLRRGVAS